MRTTEKREKKRRKSEGANGLVVVADVIKWNCNKFSSARAFDQWWLKHLALKQWKRIYESNWRIIAAECGIMWRHEECTISIPWQYSLTIASRYVLAVFFLFLFDSPNLRAFHLGMRCCLLTALKNCVRSRIFWPVSFQTSIYTKSLISTNKTKIFSIQSLERWNVIENDADKVPWKIT